MIGLRYLMTVSYDGSKFNGYQKQPEERTVQGEIEAVLAQLSNQTEVEIHASGRTDAKVHALNQKIHFDLEKELDCDKLKKACNGLLPKDIYVKSVEKTSDVFHARYQVKAKEYIYKINMGEYDPLMKDYIYQYNRKLDLVEMERAMKYLEGTHNFKSFTKASDEREDYERTIVQTNLIRDTRNVNLVILSFLGTGFMRYMVRNMVGVLIEIGEGKKKSEDIIKIFEAEDRCAAGITAKPEGLYLKDVFY